MHVRDEDETDPAPADVAGFHLRFPEHLHVRVTAIVVERRRADGASRLVVISRENPYLDAGVAERLDDIPADHLPKHGGHVRAVEQIAEDAEEGGAMLDRPSSGFREVPVGVQRAFRGSRFRIDPKIEAEACVEFDHGEYLLLPYIIKAGLMLSMFYSCDDNSAMST